MTFGKCLNDATLEEFSYNAAVYKKKYTLNKSHSRFLCCGQVSTSTAVKTVVDYQRTAVYQTVMSEEPRGSFDTKAEYKNKVREISTFQNLICKRIPHVQKEYVCSMSFFI